jgi:pseudouridine-5'-phosphate glycosidase
MAGIEVFSTGGIGGVHREPAFDESADLFELARTAAIVVCAGAKAILDLPATLERLETLGVTILGYRTNTFPGFFYEDTGLSVRDCVQSVDEIVATYRAMRALRLPGALLVVQPPPAAVALSRNEVERAVDEALRSARTAGIGGSAATPFLLSAVELATGGSSLAANLALLEANAGLAARIARSLTTSRG